MASRADDLHELVMRRGDLEQAQAENARLKGLLKLALEGQDGLFAKLEQAQGRVKVLEEAAAEAHAELEKVEQYFVARAKEQSTSEEEALLRSVFSKPFMAVVKAQAALAGGDGDASDR